MAFIKEIFSNINITAVPKPEVKKTSEEYFSDKPLGSFVSGNRTTFRIFAPHAARLFVHVFDSPGKKVNSIFEMSMDHDGVWEACILEDLSGKFYGYKILDDAHKWDGKDIPLAIDPYAKALATYADYLNPRLSIVYNEEYNWHNDKWIKINPRDLVIYEMHVKDMTAHVSSGIKNPGTYKGLTEKNKKGGLNYIKELGVNAVELLPTHEFSYYELPYNETSHGRKNTWNPYEENHWGYMTAGYFAPAAKYSEKNGKLSDYKWFGTKGKQVNDFKNMVRSFHRENIAVIMDVVFNHVSMYEIANLQAIDKDYYLRKDEHGRFTNESWCGNDLASERPMMRRLIKDSILYWMTEFHVDGFRFDLGKILDYQTLEEIIAEAKAINPDVIFIAEPWGGGYDPTGFSLRGWSTWNDQIRNGIKGENPYNGLGWIFGKYFGSKNIDCVKNYIRGSLLGAADGMYHSPELSVNFLEAHDGYTLGDFIRIFLNEGDNKVNSKNINNHVSLSAEQMRLNKLAALFLFSTQGIIMIHEGQEFARSKVIEKIKDVNDPHAGKMDHNSYEKDNNTNYINFEHPEINHELLDYYKGLIKLRNENELLRHAKPHQIKFYKTENDFQLAFTIKDSSKEFLILINASEKVMKFSFPEKKYKVLVNPDSAGINILSTISDRINILPKSGYILTSKLN